LIRQTQTEQGRRSPIIYDQFGNPLSCVPSAINERVVDDDKSFSIVKKQIVDDVIDGVARMEAPRRPKGDGVRYVGSVPILVNQIWAKECGAPVGSKEFLKYAHHKLTNGDYSKFKAWLK
jgi:hypothetical protein